MKIIKSVIQFAALLTMVPGMLIIVLTSAVAQNPNPEDSEKVTKVLENAISELQKIKAN